MRWSRDELLILLNLYHKIPFGKISARQPVIVDLAERLGRTPASVSMKMGNLASFDPALKLRGIRGLTGASILDGEVWQEFHTNLEEFVPLSQERFDALFVGNDGETTDVIPGIGICKRKIPRNGITETAAFTKQRRGQDYFRDIVLNNFANRCGLTGLPVRELLIASHILPWRNHESERLNVQNGICLNRLHDAAFDQGLMSFDKEFKMILSSRLRAHLPQQAIEVHFEVYERKPLELPDDALPPEQSFLSAHRTRFKFL